MASRGKSWLHISRMKMYFRDAFAHPLSQKLTVKSFLLCTCYMALHNNVFFGLFMLDWLAIKILFYPYKLGACQCACSQMSLKYQ